MFERFALYTYKYKRESENVFVKYMASLRIYDRWAVIICLY